MLQDLEKKTLAVSPKIVKVGYCQYSETSQKVQIMNSKGLDLSRSYSYTTTIVGPLAAEGDQTAMGFAGDINPFLSLIHILMIEKIFANSVMYHSLPKKQ